MKSMRQTSEAVLHGVFDTADKLIGLKNRKGDFLPLAGLDGVQSAGRVLNLHARAKAVLGGSVAIVNGRAVYARDAKSLVPLDHRVSDKVLFVDVANGNDVNNGTTWSLAVKSIWKAVQLGNTAAVPFTVCVANTGIYYRTNGFSNDGTEVPPTQSCSIQAMGGQVTCVVGNSLTWTLESGTTWKVVRAASKRVLDRLSYDDDGDLKEAVPVASLVACTTTPGTTYFDTGTNTLYFNRLDGLQPTDANTFVILVAIPGIRATTSGNMHLIGFTQYGGNSGCIKISGNPTGKFYAERCEFKFSATSTYVDGVQSLDYALCVFNRCVAAKNQKDGFNFHTAASVIPTAVLFDCLGYGNGTAAASTSNNGITMHDAGLCISMNCLTWGNVGGDIAHANVGTVGISICDNARGGVSDIGRGGETPDGVGFLATQGASVYRYESWGGSDFVSPSGGEVVEA